MLLDYLAMPRRTFTGLDYHREFSVAVLEKKLNIHLASYDIIAVSSGGLKLSDLRQILRLPLLFYCLLRKFLPLRAQFFGEIGLTGKYGVRSIGKSKRSPSSWIYTRDNSSSWTRGFAFWY